MNTTDVEAGLKEMNYEFVESQFALDMAVSKPAQFTFQETPAKDVQRLQDELDKKGLGSYGEYESEKGDKFYIKLEVFGHEYSRFTVKLWRDTVRIYPGEDRITKGELAQVTRAIETAFQADLEHKSIDNE